MTWPLLIVALLLGLATAEAAPVTVGPLVVDDVTASATLGRSTTAAAYVTIRNDGTLPDRLVAASSPLAERAGLHLSLVDGGVMRMRPLEAVDVPAHGEAVLAPGGVHVMLVGLEAPLRQGQSFALTLDFEHAGEVVVTATVEDIAYGGAGHAHDQHQ